MVVSFPFPPCLSGARRGRRGVGPVDGWAVLGGAMSWRDRAACKDSDPYMFILKASFDKPSPAAYEPALRVCEGCPVRAECLDYALSMDGWSADVRGVWGGMTTEQIQALRRGGKASPRMLQPCGTRAAYRRHLRRGEEPCGACKEAEYRARSVA